MNQLHDEKGVILVTVILLMAIVALLGVIAINTSTVDIQISGNLRRASSAFSGAEAGTDLSVPIIERTLAAGALDPNEIVIGGTTVDLNELGANLGDEITGAVMANVSPDFIVPDIGDGVRAEVDIERLYSYTLPGGAMEFASGYEGVGAAAAGGGIGILFRIQSEGSR